MRCLRRRRCSILSLKLLVFLVIFVCGLSILNLVCFTGVCDVAEVPNPAWSSLSDVVLEANKMSIKNHHIDNPNSFSSTSLEVEPPSKIKVLNVTKKLKSMHLTAMDFCPKEQEFLNNGTLLAGRRDRSPTKRFLSVGIPSITRKSTSYLLKTLTSIFKAIRKDEERNITIVTFLADKDDTTKQKQLIRDLSMIFKEYISKGMLHIIQAPVDFYVPLRDLHRSLGDKMDRVIWRSKQALDYSFLMCYCSYISRYYLQIEDDVLASPSFVSKVIDFVSSQKEKWISVNVALLGYIGKLYPANEVQNLASYIRLFFNDMPVDWLEPRWKKFRGQDPSKTVYIAASLFQHIGLISSFRPEESQRPNTLKEKYFDAFDHKYRGLNPPAEISSNLVSRTGQAPDAYTKGVGYFWGRCGSAGNKVYDILLRKVASLKRVVVETGANFLPRDFIIRGTLEVGRSLDVVNPKQCSNYISLGEFRFGRIDVMCNESLIRCIRINIRYQGRWIYIREVNVWTD